MSTRSFSQRAAEAGVAISGVAVSASFASVNELALPAFAGLLDVLLAVLLEGLGAFAVLPETFVDSVVESASGVDVAAFVAVFRARLLEVLRGSAEAVLGLEEGVFEERGISGRVYPNPAPDSMI
jgi:hypothetical protein